MGAKLLVVDNDPDVVAALSRQLGSAGFGIRTADNGVHALAAAVRGRHDALLLAVHLPGVDGGELCRQLRRLGDDTPVVMLGESADPELEARVLNDGADDYLIKPVDAAVLLARLHALLRRSRQRAARSAVTAGELMLDPDAHTVNRHGHEVRLTPTESAVLAVLMRHPGQVISRRQILNNVWEPAWDVYPNIVDVYVSALRRKLGQQVITTVHGVGYRLADAV